MRLYPGFLIAIGLLALAACGKPASKAPEQSSQAAPQGEAAPRTGEPQGDTAKQVTESAGQAGAAASPGAISPAAAAALSFTPDKLPAALQAIGAKPAPRGQVINACGDAVTPDVKAAELGGEIGRAYLVVIGGGPTMAACYGDSGMAIYLLKPEAHGFRMIFSGQGNLAVLPTEHKGVKDVAMAGPGFEFPVFAWNGTAYVHERTIKDADLPPTLN